MNKIKKFKSYEEIIGSMRKILYSKYSRKEISLILNVSEIQVSRLLNSKSILSFKQYLCLNDLIEKINGGE